MHESSSPEIAPPPAAAAAAGSDAALFAALWEALADVIGPGATAVFVRRAAEWASRNAPGLAGVRIERTGFDYAYALPPAWAEPNAAAPGRPVRALLEELGPLLVEMTGPVVVRRLAAEPTLRAAGLATADDVARWTGRR